MREEFKVVLFVIVFILLWGIVGKCDADNAKDIEKEKQELQEYLGEDYEIN